ncbi:MAG: YbaK/EbsC family protein [Candidatus Kerfeldbacteria bacterium]|nr:YbaK/EbsC family protein [Candidatus Kerfeldbacteria bacterium]
MAIPASVLSHLKRAKVKHAVVPHKTVFTAYDLANTLNRPLSEIAKTLVVKVDAAYVLVVVPAHTRVDFPKVKKVLAAKHVSLAPEQVMQRTFKVKPGAITPFGTLYRIPVLLDRSLARLPHVLMGAGSFEESLELSMPDYVRLEHPTVAPLGERTMPNRIPKPAPAKRKATKRPSRKRAAKGSRPAKRPVKRTTKKRRSR